MKLMDEGFGDKLMLDYWVAEDNIYLLCPAIKGCEGKDAPVFPKGECTFLNAQGLCDLHDKKLKPIEGRLANCKDPTGGQLHKAVADLWNTAEGRAAIDRWKGNIAPKTPRRMYCVGAIV